MATCFLSDWSAFVVQKKSLRDKFAIFRDCMYVMSNEITGGSEEVHRKKI